MRTLWIIAAKNSRQAEIANLRALGDWAHDMFQQIADIMTAALAPIGVLLCPDTVTPEDRARMEAFAIKNMGPMQISHIRSDMLIIPPDPGQFAAYLRGGLALGDKRKEKQP